MTMIDITNPFDLQQGEDLGTGVAGLACGGVGGGLQSSAEVKAEETSGGSWSSSQGLSCG